MLGKPVGSFLLPAALLALTSLACNLGLAPSGLASPVPPTALPEGPLLPQTSGTEPLSSTATAPQPDAPPESPTLPPSTVGPAQPTEAQLLNAPDPGLLAELYFGGGGAGEQGCGGEVPPPQQSWPAMLDLGRLDQAPDGISAYPDYDFGLLCLYGFLPEETISLEAVSPEGRVFTAERQVGDALAITPDGMPFVEIDLKWPVGFPLGEWAFSARSASVQVEGSFEVRPFLYPETSLVEEPQVNPFGSDFVASHFRGEEITVLGAGFPPGSEVPVGVYRQTDRSNAGGDQIAELVASVLLHAASDGSLEISWQTEASDPPGVDCLIAVLNRDAQHMYVAGPLLCVPLK